MTPAGVQELLQGLERHPVALRRKAQEQLVQGMQLLDTEENASFLRRNPWRGPGQAFRRDGFLTAIQAVVVAGPQAIASVQSNPANLSRYDTQEPDLEARVRSICEPATLIDAFIETDDIEFDGPTGEVPKEKNWPSLAGHGGSDYYFEPHDPDIAWLWIDDGGLNRDEEDAESWQEAAITATCTLMTKMGSQNPPDLASPHVGNVNIELRRLEPDDEDEPRIVSEQEDAALGIRQLIETETLDAVPHENRAGFLIQLIARTLLDTDVVWTTARAPLEELARPVEF